MVYHGWEVFDAAKIKAYSQWDSFKGYDSPLLMAYIGKGLELIAGLLLTVGWLTRVGALFLTITMLYITFNVAEGRFWYEDQHPFLFALLGIVYLFAGGGKYSLDRKLFN